VALNRLDVLPTLNGVEDGLWIVGQLEAHGVRVLNSASALLSAHDKLLTARLLASAGLPHPRTVRLTRTRDAAAFLYPVVAKPRFGSWGQDVVICANESELGQYLAASLTKPWGRAGAIVQEFVQHGGSDLRLVVAGGRSSAGRLAGRSLGMAHQRGTRSHDPSQFLRIPSPARSP
jgi:glutathione synthase/RimK-type ligase-like ATP-grasp enzyme